MGLAAKVSIWPENLFQLSQVDSVSLAQRAPSGTPAIDGPGHGVQHLTISRAEVAGDIAALLLIAIDLESRDLLERGDEVPIQVIADSGLSNALTRTASALFQVKCASSKLPETCNTKVSLCSSLASRLASSGLRTNATVVPNISLALPTLHPLGPQSGRLPATFSWFGTGVGSLADSRTGSFAA